MRPERLACYVAALFCALAMACCYYYAFRENNVTGKTMNTEINSPPASGSVDRLIRAGLQDTDPMPFGKYKGEPMQDVPASYLHWLWTNGKQQDKHCPVADYIRRNLSALQQEHKDGIWE